MEHIDQFDYRIWRFSVSSMREEFLYKLTGGMAIEFESYMHKMDIEKQGWQLDPYFNSEEEVTSIYFWSCSDAAAKGTVEAIHKFSMGGRDTHTITWLSPVCKKGFRNKYRESDGFPTDHIWCLVGSHTSESTDNNEFWDC